MNFDSRKNIGIRPAAALALMVALTGTLIGCESPLSSRRGSGEDTYTKSLLTRAVLEGAYGRRYGTVDGGVQEYVRIDSPGPGGVPAAAIPSFIGPMPSRLLAAATPNGTGPGALLPAGSATEPVVAEADRIPTLEAAGRVGLIPARLGQAEPLKDLTLQDAIARTMRNALAIKVESHTPAIREAQIIEAESAFDPVFFGQSLWSNNDEPFATNNTPTFNNGVNWLNQFGIRKVLPTGAQIQSTLNFNYRDVNTVTIPAATLANLGLKTSYITNIGVQVIQPLLRGFGADVNEANIYLAQRDYRISLSEFKQRVITAAANVEEAYQNVVLARTNVQVLEHLVVASQQTFNTVEARQAIDATKASMSQAAQALASRTADLLVAQKTYRAVSDRLKALMNDPEFDIAGNVLINPVDKPMNDPFSYNLEECLDTALRQRPELQQARLQVERSDIVVKVARNGLLPKLDLTMSAQSNGIDGSAGDSLGETIESSFMNFGAGVRFEVPIGNREAESVLRRRVEERKQALDNLVQIAQNVMLEVKTQLREVMSTYDELKFRNAVREHAAKEFEGIIELENIRSLTPEFLQLKLDTQARLALAEQNLIQTLVNYNLAIMRLEQAKGTLLEFDRISLDRAPVEHDEGLNSLRFLGTTWMKNDKASKTK